MFDARQVLLGFLRGELRLLLMHLRNASSFFEFGTGASTVPLGVIQDMARWQSWIKWDVFLFFFRMNGSMLTSAGIQFETVTKSNEGNPTIYPLKIATSHLGASCYMQTIRCFRRI